MAEESRQFESPHDEYVFSKEKVSLKELAKRWKAKGYTVRRLEYLSRRNNWPAKRLRYQAEMAEKAGQKLAERQAAQQVDDIERILRGARAAHFVYSNAMMYHAEKVQAALRLSGGRPVNPLKLKAAQALKGMEDSSLIMVKALTAQLGGTVPGGSFEELMQKALERMREMNVRLKFDSGGNGKKNGGAVVDVKAKAEEAHNFLDAFKRGDLLP